MDGQQPWNSQEWQRWTGEWQSFWSQWHEGVWTPMYDHWEMEMQHQQHPEQRHQLLLQQFGQCVEFFNSQFGEWKQSWHQQWGEWQTSRKLHWQSWNQQWHQQWQKSQWQRQLESQLQIWRQHVAYNVSWFQVVPQYEDWNNGWNEQWTQWQELWQAEQHRWQELEINQWQVKRDELDGRRNRRVTKQIHFIPLIDMLPYKPLARSYHCDGIPMVESTEFGRLVMDGFINELFEAHKEQLSWAGEISMEDLYVSEDGSFVYIVREPMERATKKNICLDFSQLIHALLYRYYQIGEMLPPYLSECMHRIDQLENKNGRELLVSLWVLRNHATVMDPGKWRVFFEDYYKWYKATDRGARPALLRDTNLGLCGNWPLHIVPTNQRLETVYWSGWNPDQDQVEGDTDIHNLIPFTMEDAYLAIYHRVVFVHGPEILQENISLKEFAFLMAYYFNKFLPRFIEEVFNFAQHPELTDMDRTLLKEALLAYAKRRSSSWRHHLRNMYRAEQAPSLDI